MEDDFRNLTAKVWANLDNPIKRYDFSKVSLFSCMSPSQVALFQYLWCHNSSNCLMELYTNFEKNLLFMKMYLPSSFILRYVRAEMNVHAFMNVLDQKDYWYPRKKKIVKIYVQSQWRVVLLWYHIFWQSSIQRGRHTQLCIITSLKWIIQICSNFYCWVCKIVFYSPNPHCCLGKLPL